MTKIDQKINIPGYRIIKKVGEGGMSVVFLAYQESLKREVALKVMRPIVTDEENVVSRFMQEAEIIAKLYHPNIVSIYEVGHVDDDWLFYSMPYLENGDLSTYTYQDDESLQEILVSICEGMAYAHNQGVVHRDLKPENILFDQHGHVQIADFGIALTTGQNRFTKDSRIIGSVHYMSPEQAQSKKANEKSDIYGLGVILYEILSGRPLFDEDNDLSMMMAHVTKPVPQLPSTLSHWQPIIEGCLAKQPKQRFKSMQDLQKAVERLSANPRRGSVFNWPKLLWPAVGLMLVLGTIWLLTNSRHFTQDHAADGATASSGTISNGDQGNQPLNNGLIAGSTADSEGNTDRLISTADFEDSNESRAGGRQGDGSEMSGGETEPQNSDLGLYLLSADEISQLLQQAQTNINKNQLTTPADDNALDDILLVLKDQPRHARGLEMLSEVMAGYYQLLYQAINKNDVSQAVKLAYAVSEVRHRTILVNDALMAHLEMDTELERSLLVGVVVEKVKAAQARLNSKQTNRLIRLLDQVMPGHDLIDDLLASSQNMLKAGQVLTDSQGIKTVVVTPQHTDKKGAINYGLAVTMSEITYGQFDRFSQANKLPLKRCKSELKSNLLFSQRNYTKPGFRVSDDMPVVCVTWLEANQYASWLSQQTGLHYRLPYQSEWQHLWRLSDNPFRCGQTNVAGTEFPDKKHVTDTYDCNDGSPFVAPHQQFSKNDLGLYGLGGNVSEWLAGCEELGKFKAIFNPDDACDNNPVIGRSWLSGQSDKGQVKQIDFDDAWTHIGFRLIRDLRKE